MAGSSNLSTMTEQQRRGKLSLIRREKNGAGGFGQEWQADPHESRVVQAEHDICK